MEPARCPIDEACLGFLQVLCGTERSCLPTWKPASTGATSPVAPRFMCFASVSVMGAFRKSFA